MIADPLANLTKAQLRKTALARRDAVSPASRADMSAAICRSVMQIDGVQSANIVAGYWPIRSEPDVRAVLETVHTAGHRACLPVLIDDKTIEFRHWVPGSPVVDAGFGTLGPPLGRPAVDPDALMVPLSAYDCDGNRIGYGKGHYDRAIARLRDSGRQPLLVGIAFSVQELEHIPAEPHDVGLDWVVTENGALRFDSNKEASA